MVGVYLGYMNQLNFGAYMGTCVRMCLDACLCSRQFSRVGTHTIEKGLTMAAGQTPVQRYCEMLLKKVENKELQPCVVITHEMPLDEAAEAYRIFNDKKDGCIKVVLHPRWYEEDYSGKGEGVIERAEPSL